MNNLETNKKINEVLKEVIELKGFSSERLAEISNIPERYIIALRDGDFQRLPPAPYIRGYLLKLGEILNLDGEMLWRIYKNEAPIKRSGLSDKLPSNRFVVRSFNKEILLGAFILLMMIGGWYWYSITRTPYIEIINPAVDNYIVSSSLIVVSGRINPRDQLIINGEEIAVDSNGYFKKEFVLQTGVNTLEFFVKRFLGKELRLTRQIIFNNN
jgi:cytoskeletal protein RodZ